MLIFVLPGKEKMKVIKTIEEAHDEGLISLIGQRITCFCAIYIYTGDLVGVSDTCIKLENPAVVYETGAFDTKVRKDVQPLPGTIYVKTGMIEAFGIVK
jgi:hypothetical protein